MAGSGPRRLGRRGRVLAVSALAATVVVAGGVWWGLANDAGSTAAGEPDRSTGSTPSPDPSGAAPSTDAPGAEPSAPAADGQSPAPDAASIPAGDVPDQAAVPELEVVELPAVEISAPADFGNSVSARLTQVVRVDGVGKGIGERSGPALLVTVEIVNGSAAEVDLDYVVVNLYGADGAPGPMLLGDGRSAPFSGVLAPGASGTGSYVLRLPDPQEATVTVTVSYGAQTPTAIFTGDVDT